jgi:hypothetical protein
MTTNFLKWWLVFVIQAITLGIIVYFGGMDYLLANDQTFLSFFIIFLWIITSLSIGYNLIRKKPVTDMHWFITDSCMSLGMIGTVLGFIIMLSTTLESIDPSNIESMKLAISQMASGMSIALLTTLCGLVTSLFLRVQLIVAEED